MHTVCETKIFRNSAADVGMTPEEIDGLIQFLSQNPDAGEVMQGTGGCRKLRVAGKQKGKSGGFRTITFYTGKNLPVFLLVALSKSERANLSKQERNTLQKITKEIVEEYKAKVKRMVAK